jgi:predicted GIY-YIG superfamily endonuclease
VQSQISGATRRSEGTGLHIFQKQRRTCCAITREEIMDKQIKKIQKGTKTLLAQENNLLKQDQKRDKICDYGAKMMKEKQKKDNLRSLYGKK